MLGIRKHRGVQIDLHLGDPTRFACDLVAPLDERGGAGVTDALGQAAAKNVRHLVLAPSADARGPQAAETFAALREFLDASQAIGFRRVTVALATHAQYDLFGEAMVVTFPEAETAHNFAARPRPGPREGGL